MHTLNGKIYDRNNDSDINITGQSENSSGAMVRSQSVPCDFVLVASGNIKVLEVVISKYYVIVVIK